MSSSAVETESSNDSKDVVILADDEHSSTDNSMHAYEEASHSKPQVGSKRSLPAEAGPLAKEPKIRNDSVRSGGEANCPICLNALTDATVLNACPHVFCYGCICEWLKMKAECPLCKRSLQYLKHNLRPAADEKPTFESQGEMCGIASLSAASVYSFTKLPYMVPARISANCAAPSSSKRSVHLLPTPRRSSGLP